jgi:phosphoribosylformylglycinamidine synthase
MLKALYKVLDQDIFTIVHQPEPVIYIDDIAAYNQQEAGTKQRRGSYLECLTNKLGRKLTDSEVFGFSQVNSEHCRHKIFNGKFVIDGQENRYPFPID